MLFALSLLAHFVRRVVLNVCGRCKRLWIVQTAEVPALPSLCRVFSTMFGRRQNNSRGGASLSSLGWRPSVVLELVPVTLRSRRAWVGGAAALNRRKAVCLPRPGCLGMRVKKSPGVLHRGRPPNLLAEGDHRSIGSEKRVGFHRCKQCKLCMQSNKWQNNARVTRQQWPWRSARPDSCLGEWTRTLSRSPTRSVDHRCQTSSSRRGDQTLLVQRCASRPVRECLSCIFACRWLPATLYQRRLSVFAVAWGLPRPNMRGQGSKPCRRMLASTFGGEQRLSLCRCCVALCPSRFTRRSSSTGGCLTT